MAVKNDYIDPEDIDEFMYDQDSAGNSGVALPAGTVSVGNVSIEDLENENDTEYNPENMDFEDIHAIRNSDDNPRELEMYRDAFNYIDRCEGKELFEEVSPPKYWLTAPTAAGGFLTGLAFGHPAVGVAGAISSGFVARIIEEELPSIDADIEYTVEK